MAEQGTEVTDHIPEIMGEIANVGWSCLKEPDKVLIRTFPDYRGKAKWQIIANGNRERKEAVADQWGKIEVPAFTVAVFWNGWLAGFIDTSGGNLFANPHGANEDALIESLRRIER